jgi:hypothetical protein
MDLEPARHLCQQRYCRFSGALGKADRLAGVAARCGLEEMVGQLGQVRIQVLLVKRFQGLAGLWCSRSRWPTGMLSYKVSRISAWVNRSRPGAPGTAATMPGAMPSSRLSSSSPAQTPQSRSSGGSENSRPNIAARLSTLAHCSGRRAQEIIAEIGVDMARFPTPGHLVSWAKFSPTARQSADKSKPGSTGKGNPWLGGALGEAVIGATRTKTFPGARYHRLARRRGKRRALVAVGNSILTIAHRLLSDPATQFSDLGPDWHDRIAPLRRKRQLIAELERLSGKKVIL